jgi:LacI family transcriptional regulator
MAGIIRLIMSRTRSPKRQQPHGGIESIARELGVSIGTVDRALHNRPGISVVTRARVLDMAKKMSYRPNLAARDLSLKRHFKISINLPTETAAFFDELRRGITEGSLPFSSNMELQFRTHPRRASHERGDFQEALDASANGIIISPGDPSALLPLVREAHRRKIAVICVGTDAPDSGRLTAITANPYTAGSMAAEYLERCIRKPGPVVVFTGQLTAFSHSERIRGFRNALAENSKHKREALIVESHDNATQAYSDMRKMMKSRPDLAGVYVSTANSLPVLKALEADGELGKMPIVTTDLFPDLADHLRSQAVAATIDQRPRSMGRIAIRTLYQYLSDGATPPASIELVPQLVIRSNVDLMLKYYGSAPSQDFGIPAHQAFGYLLD